MEKWMQDHPVTVAIAGLVIGYVGARIIPETGQAAAILKRVQLSVIMLCAMAAVGGRGALRWEKGSFISSVFMYKSMLIIMTLIGAHGILSAVGGQRSPGEGWGPVLLLAAVEYLMVGLFEESCFRGVMLGGIMARLGRTRRGVYAALVISAFLFGFAHVALDAIGPLSVSTAIQIFTKTLSSGIMGLLIGAVYLKTKNIWAVAILHGYSDFIVMASERLYGSGGGERIYVDPEMSVAAALTSAAVLLGLRLWPLIAGIRLMKKLPVPQEGIWEEARKNA